METAYEYAESDADSDDLYSEKEVEQLAENDELSAEEEGFMTGYNRSITGGYGSPDDSRTHPLSSDYSFDGMEEFVDK